MSKTCQCVIKGPPGNYFEEKCVNEGTYTLMKFDGKKSYLCNTHSRMLRKARMYEAGQIRKIPSN